MAQSDLVAEKLAEIERAVRLLERKRRISQRDASARITGIRRCVRLWHKGGRPSDWIVNQLAAAESDLQAEFEPRRGRPA